MRHWPALALLPLLAAAPAGAQTAPVVTQAWARATAATAQTGAAYLTVHAAGADAITGFSTPAAASAMLHQSKSVNGVMEMREVESLPIAAGGDVKLAPGGYHVMLMGLKQPLKPGEHFALTVKFAHAAPVITEVAVGKAGASAPGADPMAGMKMP